MCEVQASVIKSLSSILSDDDLSKATVEQWSVICHRDANLLVTAAPATGKSHTLVMRHEQLLSEGLSSLMLVFNADAAQSLKKRLSSSSRSSVFTIDGYAFKCLRDHVYGPNAYDVRWNNASGSRKFRVSSDKRIVREVHNWFLLVMI